jgi:hypothetical protein
MTKHHFLYPALIAIILLFIGFWVQEKIANVKAQAIEDAQKQVQAEAQKRIDDREKQFDMERKQLLDKIKAVKTPQQAITALPSVVELPKPIEMLPDAPSANGGSGQVSGGAVIPTESIKPLFDRLATCKLTESGLTQCQADKKDMQIQLDAANVEAHQWKLAAKGGTKWHKFGKALKVIACAGGGAAIGSFSQQKQMGAAIGAAGGAAVCSIF